MPSSNVTHTMRGKPDLAGKCTCIVVDLENDAELGIRIIKMMKWMFSELVAIAMKLFKHHVV